MLRVALRGLLSRKLRLALTALAVALGVAFVAGAYVLTDTMSYAFSSLFSQTGSKVDVYVQSPSRYSNQANSFMASDRAPVPDGLMPSVLHAAGVATASGEVFGFAQIVDRNGKAISPLGGAPTLGYSTPSDSSLNSVVMRTGRTPQSSEEVAIDAHTATTNGFKVGDRVTILLQGPSRQFTLVGTFGFGDNVDSMAGATVATFDLRTAQGILGKAGVYDSILVKAQPGWTQQQLRDSVAAAVPSQWEVITGQAQADQVMESVKQGMGFFSTAMLAFAGIALFVGAFIIFNTFSILVAQRTREFGLLRALGAQVRQIVVAVAIEALAVGLLASVIGLALGAGIAVGLTQAMKAIGLDLPPAPLQYQARTLVAGLAVGVGVTLVAALGPALRTRSLSPITALNLGLGSERRRSMGRRLSIGGVAAVTGVGTMIVSATGRTGHGLVLFILGAALVFLSASALSAFTVKPLAEVIGWPLVRLFHLPARLGLRNATRSPARTARTAAALMIGIGLISFVTVLGASMKASATAAIDGVLTADYVLMPTSQMGGFSPNVVDGVRSVPGVESVGEIRVGYFEKAGALQGVGGVDPSQLQAIAKVDVLAGDLMALSQGGVALGRSAANSEDVHVGDSYSMTFDHTGTQSLPVVAIYDDSNGSIGRFLMGMSTFSSNFSNQLDYMVGIKLSAAADRAAASAAIAGAVAAYPNIKLQDHAAFRADALAQVDQLLSLVYTLLALAVVIAFLGIVNTLALSTLERVRELGLLRAIGMTRREVRQMVRHEAVIVAILGGMLGLVVGLGFAKVALVGMRDSGMGVASYPALELAVFVLLSGVAGVLAAILPARRAARVDVLQAVSTT